MRIGIDARLNYYRPGGIAEYTRHVIEELAALDQTTGFKVIHHHADQNTLVPGPNFERIDAYTPCHHRLERWSLSAELARYRLDLLHSPDFIPPLRGARRQVITVHDLHFLFYPQFMTADSRRYYNNQIARAVRSADHILVDSQATCNDLANLLHVPVDKMTVHMLGVDPAFAPLPDGDIARQKARFGLPQSYILFVGTFEPRKNISGLFEAYHRLRQEMPDVPPLVMVGRRGWLYDDIYAKAEALRLTDGLVWLEDPPWSALPTIYNGADVLALPSFYEGFGLTALEAMACGTPTVVADRGSLPEVVGDTGLLIDPDDTAGLAGAIRQVLTDSDLRDRLRTAGLARAATFTWQNTASIVLGVYRRVLAS
jgi:glycosyltransferase involved in cell wall biosynthesis